MAHRQAKSKATAFFVDQECHPQNIAVMRTRAEPLGIEIVVGDPMDLDASAVFGALFQYPGTRGHIMDFTKQIDALHEQGALGVVSADPLALCLLKPPGEMGADIVVGSMQRFGVPMGYGGPHAAYMATKDAHKRAMPGRLVGVSVDARGNRAYRLALQTREQHIRREKATSNICTAQVLLAVIAGMYAVFHGPRGLQGHRRAGAPQGGPHGRRTGGAGLSLRAQAVLRHDHGRGRPLPGADPEERRRPGAELPQGGRPPHRHHRRRAHPARDGRGRLARLWRLRSALSRQAPGVPAAEEADPAERLSRPPDLPHEPGRVRDDALHAAPGRPRPGARPLDDPARQLHDEAERDRRDAADHLAGVRRAAPLRPGEPGRGLCRADRRPLGQALRRSPATTPSRCSRTRARRANMPA